MRAIILTYAPVNNEEKKLLRNTKVFKMACNSYCAELKPNLRLCADNIVQKCLDCDSCDVVSLNYDLERERVINGCYLPKRHSSLLSCIDYLYLKGFTDILLVASNPDSATSKINYIGVNDIKDCLNLYKYTKDGNLDIPYMTIKEFLMLTDEEKLLGIEQTPERKLFKKTIFTDSVLYTVQTEGKDNQSEVGGEIINNILSFEAKQKLLEGAEEVKDNGMIIKRITQITPKKEVKKAEVKEEKEEIKEEVKETKPAKKTVKKKGVK